MNILGLRLDLDPDVVAAMDDDFDFEDPDNQLEDNFIELANASASEEEYDAEFENSDVDSNFAEEEEERDEVGSLNGSQFSFNEEETKSRFTQYSMSSSVIRRNQQLTLLDDRFEKVKSFILSSIRNSFDTLKSYYYYLFLADIFMLNRWGKTFRKPDHC